MEDTLNYAKKKLLKYGQKRRRRYGNGTDVQATTRAGASWSSDDDRLIGQYDILDDAAVGRLVHRLNRPPSEIRNRHTYLLQQQLRARREAAIRISEKLNRLRQPQQHP